MTSMSGSDENLASEAVDFSGPAVYMFRPTQYVKVPSERMAEWQQTLVDKVGLKPVEGMLPEYGTYSLCGSTFFSEACDCDE